MSRRFWACLAASSAATWATPNSGNLWVDWARDMPLAALVIAAVYLAIGAIRETPTQPQSNGD